MTRLDLPAPVRERAERAIESTLPHGRTMAVFANESALISEWLRPAVPIDEQTGLAYARWGEADVAPLWYLQSIREHALVAYVDRDHFRLFDVLVDDVTEIDRRDRSISSAERDSLQSSKQEHPAYVADRGSAADNASAHVEELARRFHREAVAAVESAMANDLEVVLLGPPEARADFESLLPQAVRERVATRLNGMSSPGASTAELHDRVVPTLRALRDARQGELLDAVQSSSIIGPDQTLDALQQGRLETIVATWPLRAGEVFEHPETGFLASASNRAQIGDGEVERIDLDLAIQRLSQRYGTPVEFVSGHAGQELDQKFSGIAGLPRW
jgi:hypothetical protein